jgi:anti-sigma factor RsiW
VTCSDYELLIGDAVDGTLDPAQQQALDAHLATCARCRALAGDFRTLRALSQTLEPQVPPPQVWNRIAAAVESDRRRWWAMAPLVTGWRPAAVAALSVVVVAGILWLAWPTLSPQGSVPVSETAATEEVSEPQADVEADMKLAEDEYASAIAGLEEIAKTSSSELDPETADVLQANLVVIDQAIGESRAALQTEPASEAAQESLFDALRDKVVLLQETVALINEMRKGNQEGAARIVSEINQ